MYAVLSSGGKQYRVEPGTTLLVERITGEPGASVTFDRVLLVADGDDVTVGRPTVAGASISGTILGEELGPKIVVFKYKQKIKYRRRTGHRQHLLRVRIDEISANGKSVKVDAEEADKADKAEAKPKKTAEEPMAATAEDADAGSAQTEDAKPAKAKRTSKAKSEAAPRAEAKSKTKEPKTSSRAKRPKADDASGEVEKPKPRSRAKSASKPKADKE